MIGWVDILQLLRRPTVMVVESEKGDLFESG
jgi:hypothetical protein